MNYSKNTYEFFQNSFDLFCFFFWIWPFFKNFKKCQKFLKKFLRILWIILNIFCTLKFFCQVDIFRIKKLPRSLSRFIVIIYSPWVVVDKKIHLTKNIENYSKYSLRIFSEFFDDFWNLWKMARSKKKNKIRRKNSEKIHTYSLNNSTYLFYKNFLLSWSFTI